MTGINNAYINALLADVSYVDDLAGGSVVTDELEERITPTQAEFVGDNFIVLEQVSFPDTDFQAIVLQGKIGSDYARAIFLRLIWINTR